MSANQLNPEEWGRRLEAGDRSDPALRLAAQLEQNRPAAPLLDHASRENLRRRLLRQADAAPAQRLGSLAVSFAVTLLLATAVALFWTSQAGNQPILPGAADEDATADAVALTLTDSEGELAELELELRELEAAAASWQIAPLRQSAADGRLFIDTTLTYDPAAPPPTITLLLGPASWRGGGVNRNEAVETAVLNPADIAAAEGEIAVRFTVDPLAVWERFNDYELVLAAEIEYETADGAVVASALERQLTLQVAWLDGLWLNSVTPEPGTPLDNAAFTVELGYRLLSAPAADVRLLIAAPNWESASGDRLPVTGAAESIRVARGEGVLTFAFTTEDAAYLHNLLGDEATLAANMLASGDDGMMQALAQRTFGDYRWPVADLADHVWPVADEAAKAYCPVTLPTDPLFTAPSPYPPHAPYADRFWYGTESLWTMLPTDGTWQHRGIKKIWWWREGYNGQEEQQPLLSMTAVRLDSPAAPAIEIDPPATNGYHADFHWAMLSGLNLPSGGCWQITGHYHDHELSFVVWVTDSDYVWTPDRLWFVDIAPAAGNDHSRGRYGRRHPGVRSAYGRRRFYLRGLEPCRMGRAESAHNRLWLANDYGRNRPD
jgi:hypothetical protein